jgi:hypothetical protein
MSARIRMPNTAIVCEQKNHPIADESMRFMSHRKLLVLIFCPQNHPVTVDAKSSAPAVEKNFRSSMTAIDVS